MITFSGNGNWSKSSNFLKGLLKDSYLDQLHKYGKEGVAALKASTPVDSGETANSWRYEIEKKQNGYVITWCNDHVNNNVNIAVILQYGHGTKNGGWVEGIDYINPSMKTVFDNIATSAWKEVVK